jgi:AraC-like DNA-binding protein
MQSERYTPAEILKPFIKTFMIIESENGMENRILPDTSIVMAFRCKGSVTYSVEEIQNRLPVSVITGLRKSTRLINYSTNTTMLLVIFKEGGAAAFFNESLHELFGISLSLDNLIPYRKLAEIEEQLAEAKNNRLRIYIIERFLIAKLKTSRPDLLIFNAIQKIKSAQGDIRIKDLLTGLYISQDPFEKRFRKLIGTSPKQFASIVRMRNLIDNYSKTSSLTHTAYSAGYFDQAHFIKDFRSFTGQAPLEFFKSPSYW